MLYLLEKMTALAPCLTKASVIPRQMPEPPPVHNTTFPVKRLSLKISVVFTTTVIIRIYYERKKKSGVKLGFLFTCSVNAGKIE